MSNGLLNIGAALQKAATPPYDAARATPPTGQTLNSIDFLDGNSIAGRLGGTAEISYSTNSGAGVDMDRIQLHFESAEGLSLGKITDCPIDTEPATCVLGAAIPPGATKIAAYPARCLEDSSSGALLCGINYDARLTTSLVDAGTPSATASDLGIAMGDDDRSPTLLRARLSFRAANDESDMLEYKVCAVIANTDTIDQSSCVIIPKKGFLKQPVLSAQTLEHLSAVYDAGTSTLTINCRNSELVTDESGLYTNGCYVSGINPFAGKDVRFILKGPGFLEVQFLALEPLFDFIQVDTIQYTGAYELCRYQTSALRYAGSLCNLILTGTVLPPAPLRFYGDSVVRFFTDGSTVGGDGFTLVYTYDDVYFADVRGVYGQHDRFVVISQYGEGNAQAVGRKAGGGGGRDFCFQRQFLLAQHQFVHSISLFASKCGANPVQCPTYGARLQMLQGNNSSNP